MFILGMIIGGVIGFFIAACCQIAGKEAEQEEEPFNVELQIAD